MLRSMRTEPHLSQGLRDLLEAVGPVETVVEVGVYAGESTAIISEYARHVFAVDLWNGRHTSEDRRYEEAEKAARGRKYKCRVTFLKMSSVEAALQFSYVDMVYIDACHKYAAVKEDILAWQDRCRILAGHDYGYPRICPGVKEAVDELVPKVRTFQDTSWLRVVEL